VPAPNQVRGADDIPARWRGFSRRATRIHAPETVSEMSGLGSFEGHRRAKIQDGTRAYGAVFGTRFLELGRLVIEPKGESHFAFHQNSITLPVEQAGPPED